MNKKEKENTQILTEEAANVIGEEQVVSEADEEISEEVEVTEESTQPAEDDTAGSESSEDDSQDYEDEAEQEDEAAEDETVTGKTGILKKILKGFLAVAGVVLIVTLTLVLTPRIKYYWAMHLVDGGEYQEAYDLLTEISESYEPAKKELGRFIITYETKETYSDLSKGALPDSVREFKHEFGKNYHKKTSVNEYGMEVTEEYTYDKDGNIIQEIIPDGYGTPITTRHEYNRDGKVIKSTSTADYASLITEYKYDKNGNCTEVIQTLVMEGQTQEQKEVTKSYSMHYVKK